MTTKRKVVRTAAGGLLLGGVAVSALIFTAGTAHAFDPQPDPPRVPNISSQHQSPGAHVGFDPQPEPPARPSINISIGR